MKHSALKGVVIPNYIVQALQEQRQASLGSFIFERAMHSALETIRII